MATSPHEWLCRYIVDNTQDAIIFADRAGMIRLWNAGAEAIFGYSAAEALGHSLDLIIPERLRARHWEGYRRVSATGITPYDRRLLAVPAIRKDGTQISLEFTVVIVHEPRGRCSASPQCSRGDRALAAGQGDTGTPGRLRAGRITT